MTYLLAQDRLGEFLRLVCGDRPVIALEPDGGQLHLVRSPEWDPDRHVLGEDRPVEPLKSLLFRPRESLGSVGGASGEASVSPQAVIGIKNCDLSALRIHDHVFLDTDPADPSYAAAREQTVLISCDCTDCRDVCFCTAVGEQPYPKEGFDINISPIARGYVIETGGERGESLASAASQCLAQADASAIEERANQRAAMAQRVAGQSAGHGLSPEMDYRKAVAATEESRIWEEFAEDCVECGACNFVCCTCHCFLLMDGRATDESPARVKQWDSCLYANFARVAGGANPRGHRAERLYNRFDKKFNFFPQVLDRYACDGCGRCAEACTGAIDIRKVLKKTVDEANEQ